MPREQVLLQYMPDGWQGVDVHGNPVLWEFLGASRAHPKRSPGAHARVAAAGGIDPKGLLRAVRKEDIAKYRGMYRGESALRRMREQTAAQGRLISRVTVVLDLSGVGLSHLHGPFTNIVREVVKGAT